MFEFEATDEELKEAIHELMEASDNDYQRVKGELASDAWLFLYMSKLVLGSSTRYLEAAYMLMNGDESLMP